MASENLAAAKGAGICHRCLQPVQKRTARCPHCGSRLHYAWYLPLIPLGILGLHVFLASSDLHLEYKLKLGRAEALDLAGESVRLARSLVDDVEFSPEDAFRSDRDFMVEMVRIAVEAGATTINMPDTVGYTTPEEYGQMFREVRERIPAIDAQGIVLSSHCHDDLGLAVANSLAAINAGARQVECTINGIGERAGNAALE